MGLFGGSNSMNPIDTAIAAIPGVGAYQGAVATNAANLAIANKQMKFQKEMSNTAYQRGMADMKLAGLNPMLAFERGGASTPAGASATMTNPGEAMASGIANTASQYAQYMGLQNQTMQTEADIQNKQADAQLMQAKTEESKINTAIQKRNLPGAEMKHDVFKGIQNFVKPIMNHFKNGAKPIQLTPKQREHIKRSAEQQRLINHN